MGQRNSTEIRSPVLERRLDILQHRVSEAFKEDGVKSWEQDIIWDLMIPLRAYHLPSYLASLSVGLISRDIAKFYDLEKSIAMNSGMLHDVGKVGVRKAILNKKGKLTEGEFEEMKAHVRIGYDILAPRSLYAPFLVVPSLVAGTHHPYTYLPKKNELHPKLQMGNFRTIAENYVRIVSVADKYDASHRRIDWNKGRKTNSKETKEMLLQFDPKQKYQIDLLYKNEVLR